MIFSSTQTPGKRAILVSEKFPAGKFRIRSQIIDLASFKSGSKEKADAIDDLATLYKLRIEEVKAEMDLDDKVDARDSEDRYRQEQLKERTKDRYINLGIAAAGIVLPLIFNCVWMSKGFEFEKTGTFTSTTFRNLFSRFRTTTK